MMVISLKMILMDMELIDGEMGEFFKEIGDVIKWMEWEFSFGLIRRNT